MTFQAIIPIFTAEYIYLDSQQDSAFKRAGPRPALIEPGGAVSAFPPLPNGSGGHEAQLTLRSAKIPSDTAFFLPTM